MSRNKKSDLFGGVLEQRPDEPDAVQLMDLDQGRLLLGASPQGQTDIDQEVRMGRVDQLDQRAEPILVLEMLFIRLYHAGRSLLHPYERAQAHKGVTMIDPHCTY